MLRTLCLKIGEDMKLRIKQYYQVNLKEEQGNQQIKDLLSPMKLNNYYILQAIQQEIPTSKATIKELVKTTCL